MATSALRLARGRDLQGAGIYHPCCLAGRSKLNITVLSPSTGRGIFPQLGWRPLSILGIRMITISQTIKPHQIQSLRHSHSYELSNTEYLVFPEPSVFNCRASTASMP